jgi:hypothetical protein
MTIPLPIINNVYRVTLRWVSNNSQIAANVMHYQHSGGTALDVKNAIDANVTAAMWTPILNTCHVTQLDIIKLDGVQATVSFPVTGTKWQGSVATQDFNPAISAIVKHVTGVRGRDNRGRTYLPFVGDAAADYGSLNGTNAATVSTAWNAFLAAMTTATTFPVVAAYDRAHAGAGAHSTIINQFVCEVVVGTQRRRQQRLR